MKKYLIAILSSFLVVSAVIGGIASAQDSSGKNDRAKVQGQAGETKFDIRVQGEKQDRSPNVPQPGGGERSVPGPQGPAGAPGPQGPAGPSGSSSGTFLGMDSTVALFLGLGVFAIVVIAIVASSRGGSRHA
jgi:hypothetical protein